jgi:hypothetical protein
VRCIRDARTDHRPWSGRHGRAEFRGRYSRERRAGILAAADLRDYDRWLPASSAFHGTATTSEGPIAVGTTYVEPGPLGTRRGLVKSVDRPTRLGFEQPMALKPRFMGVIGIRLSHALMASGLFVHLLRELELSPRGPIRLAMPFVLRMFRVENERMMTTLKTEKAYQLLNDPFWGRVQGPDDRSNRSATSAFNMAEMLNEMIQG